MRWLAIAVLVALPAVVISSGRPVEPALPAAAAVTHQPAVEYGPPVVPMRVLRGFEPPPSPYGPGHRGIDLAISPGQPVHAAAAGVVSFAGPVAGRGVVVIAHADGVSTEYEPLAPSVTAGASVAAGAAIGRVVGSHEGCPPGACLHWGARRGDSYFDPLTLLRPLGPVRLLPWGPDG
jgi:murein DD-endopeptidase MepM/ murein hydrolase activator NlpD